MFKKKTLNDILSSFNGVISDIDALQKFNDTRVSQIDAQQRKLAEEKTVLTEESATASRVRSRIYELIS